MSVQGFGASAMSGRNCNRHRGCVSFEILWMACTTKGEPECHTTLDCIVLMGFFKWKGHKTMEASTSGARPYSS